MYCKFFVLVLLFVILQSLKLYLYTVYCNIDKCVHNFFMSLRWSLNVCFLFNHDHFPLKFLLKLPFRSQLINFLNCSEI